MKFKIRTFSLWLALSLFVFASMPAAELAAPIEQWGIYEITLAGPASGNPFTEVDVSARFTQDERVVEVSGFYDGEGVYKIRFMPDLTGTWRYATSSNQPELAGKRGEITVTPPTQGNHGPVRVAHTFHFAYADGTPYRQLGTTSYMWAQQPEAQQELTLRTLADSPFNKLRMFVLPQGASNRPLRLYPFAGTAPRAWDLDRFNPAYFRELERRVQQLGELGIEADLILFHPYDTKLGLNSMDAARDDRYVRYVVARLAAYRNVWWSLANEYDFNKDKIETDWDRLFQAVQASDPYGHLRSIHNGYRIYNHTLPWVTHASLQQGAALMEPERAMIYRDVYRKPVVYDEVKYEGNNSRRWGQLKPEELVLLFWNGTIAGSYVGHGEAINQPGVTGGAWLSSGGTFRGESVPRLAFLKKIIEDSPPEGIEPIDKWQERRMGGKAGDYYLVYLGELAPAEWAFVLYKTGLVDGLKFTVDVIDTWNMTLTPVEGVFETKKKDDYVFVDKEGRSVPLPKRPYQAIRIRRIGPAPQAPANREETEL